MRYCVVDVETTGGDPSHSRITEVGMVILDGDKVVDTFQTLINPQTPVPLNIRVLTGIHDEMLADAPLFEEAAQEIHERLKGAVFVAHNVKFDYAFITAEFKRAGIRYSATKRLCTVKYTRNVLPGLKRYNLAALCKQFEIENEDPHRALGDAKAAADVLRFVKKMDRKELYKHMLKFKSRESSFPQNLNRSMVDEIPAAPGIYFFKNKSGKVLYVGKARNMRKRVLSHFSGTATNHFYQSLNREVNAVEHFETGSETLAALYEDHEIMHRWPRYNRAQKKRPRYYGVYAYRDHAGNYRLGINRVRNQYPPLRRFHSLYAARKWLLRQITQFELDAEKCNFSFLDHADEGIQVHNKHFEQMKEHLLNERKSILILKPGRTKDERGFIFIENDQYRGVGFAPAKIDLRSEPEKAREYLQLKKSGTLTDKIIEKELTDEDSVCIEYQPETKALHFS